MGSAFGFFYVAVREEQGSLSRAVFGTFSTLGVVWRALEYSAMASRGTLKVLNSQQGSAEMYAPAKDSGRKMPVLDETRRYWKLVGVEVALICVRAKTYRQAFLSCFRTRFRAARKTPAKKDYRQSNEKPKAALSITHDSDNLQHEPNNRQAIAQTHIPMHINTSGQRRQNRTRDSNCHSRCENKPESSALPFAGVVVRTADTLSPCAFRQFTPGLNEIVVWRTISAT